MRTVAYLVIVLSTVFLISGCAGRSRLEENYGASVKLSTFNQILDPDAEKKLEPVTGMDGIAAQISIERYRKSFEQPAKNSQYIFNMGALGGNQDSQN